MKPVCRYRFVQYEGDLRGRRAVPCRLGESPQNRILKLQSWNGFGEHCIERRCSFCRKLNVFFIVQCRTEKRADDGAEKTLPIGTNQNPGLGNRDNASIAVVEFDGGSAPSPFARKYKFVHG